MYEKITGYLDAFENGAASDEELRKKITSFVDDFSQSGFMNPDAMQVMAEHDWATRTALRNDAPSMSAGSIWQRVRALSINTAYSSPVLSRSVQARAVL